MKIRSATRKAATAAVEVTGTGKRKPIQITVLNLKKRVQALSGETETTKEIEKKVRPKRKSRSVVKLDLPLPKVESKTRVRSVP